VYENYEQQRSLLLKRGSLKLVCLHNLFFKVEFLHFHVNASFTALYCPSGTRRKIVMVTSYFMSSQFLTVARMKFSFLGYSAV
jgi:hypothetical protein